MSNNRPGIRSWSPEEEAQLLALFDSGMTASEIGQRLGRTRLAVYSRLQRFHKQQGRVSRTSGRDFAQRAGWSSKCRMDVMRVEATVNQFVEPSAGGEYTI